MAIDILSLDTEDETFEEKFGELLNWSVREDESIVERVRVIIDDVKTRGDAALLDYTNRLDRQNVERGSDLVYDPAQMHEAWLRIPQADREALTFAKERIHTYHRMQDPIDHELEDEFGNRARVRHTPIERVGIYVPGGKAAYPSTVLMTAIPAQVAGVAAIYVATPAVDDQVSDYLLAALHVAELPRAYSIGGAQAIAAFAYGTETIPRVDKIVGPGGAWVAAAKKLVFGPVGIESLAGPSEILIVTDGSVNPEWVAWDLLSQAEHDEHAQAILLCTDRDYIELVAAHMAKNLESSPRRMVTQTSLEKRGAFIHVRAVEEAVELSNRIAPEHLQLAVENPLDYLDNVRHAGAVFLGGYSAEVLGDYVAGPSHVLPTYGTARYASVLGVQDFMKRQSVIDISQEGGQVLGRTAGTLADIEGLYAHAQAARVRVRDYDHNR